MKAIIFLLCLFPLTVLANWKMEVALGVDGETWKIDRASKFDNAKETVVDYGRYILKMTLSKGKEPNSIDVSYTVHEKKGENMILVNKGVDSIDEKASSEIYAKGEPNQPNSIITLKLTK